jgi:hypothetical protein
MNTAPKSQPTIFLYTEEQRGNQLVESIVIGTIADISSSDKLVVVQDPNSGLKYVYAVHVDTRNLDAVGVTDLDNEKFDDKTRTVINDSNYRLGSPEQAMKYLRNHTRWIQDKGSVMSVLLHYAASRRHNLSAPRSINRTRRVTIPDDAPVETLEALMSAKAAAAAAMVANDAIESLESQPQVEASPVDAPTAEEPPTVAS